MLFVSWSSVKRKDSIFSLTPWLEPSMFLVMLD